jgi:hypothetical protein
MWWNQAAFLMVARKQRKETGIGRFKYTYPSKHASVTYYVQVHPTT